MRRYLTLLLILVSIVGLVACNSQNNLQDTKDRIEVYDKNHNLVAEIVDQEEIDYYSDLVGNTTENMDETEDFPLVKLPEDAVVSYEYRFITSGEDGKDRGGSFYVYDNYQLITLKGTSILPTLTWDISEEEYIVLNSIED